MRTPLRPTPRIALLSTVDDGSQLLVTVEFGDVGYDLITVVADDEDESLWVAFAVDGKEVQVPLSVVKSAVDQAPSRVHSESWFRKNTYSDDGAGLTNAGRAFAKTIIPKK